MNYRQPTLSLCAGYVTGHSAARWSGFTCAGARLSAPGLMPSPLGDHICASKRQRKRTLIEWRTVAGRLCNGNKQEATTQEMMLHNWQGTFTPHRRAAKWKTGYSSVDRGEGRKNRAIVWMFGVRASKRRGVWENVSSGLRGRRYSASVGRTNVPGDRKSFVWIEMSLLIIMHEALWESPFK